ncbi:MAG: beta-ketoacyl synthase N-terminal-like domain-containing protein [Cyanobacteria bacterium J06631_2]
MGCRFPQGATSPEAYWKLLRDGVNTVTQVPAERWDIDRYYDPDPNTPGQMYTRYGSFLDDVDCFDANFFEKATVAGVHLTWSIGVGIVIAIDIPAFGWHLGHGINTVP